MHPYLDFVIFIIIIFCIMWYMSSREDACDFLSDIADRIP